MHFTISFSSLLVSLLFVLLVQQDVEAVPVARQPKFHSMPLKRMAANTSLHPLVLLQQQLNRADRRLARMTGRAEPSDEELVARLHKRLVSLEESGHIDRRDKRYNRIGVKGKRFYRPNMTPGPSNLDGKVDVADKGGSFAAVGNGAATKGAATGGQNGAAAGNSTGGDIGGPDSANGQVTVGNKPTADNSLALDIEGQDTGYLATVPMGTPPRNFLILMDSGSADLWVGSEDCQNSQGQGDCGKHQFLGPKSSSSFKASNTPFEITYGTGAVQGLIVQDDINVAGLDLKGHTFGVAQKETQDFSDDGVSFDGLMGLARSQLSNQKTLTPVEALAKSGQIKDAITSYKISRKSDNKNDGEITFGGIDQTKIDPKSLTELENVSQKGFYEAKLDGVAVNGKDAGLQGRTAIIDTGTSLIIAPPQDATAVLQGIQGAAGNAQQGFTVPCNNKDTVTMTFGGQKFDINPADMAAGPANPQNPNSGDCLSGIQAGQVGGAQEWLVGDVFLKNAYFSHDATKNTLSLAKLA